MDINCDTVAGATVGFDGASSFGKLALPGFSLPSGSRFDLGARTGGEIEITTR